MKSMMMAAMAAVAMLGLAPAQARQGADDGLGPDQLFVRRIAVRYDAAQDRVSGSVRVFEFPEVEDVARATVSITWTKPDGRTEAQQAQSGSDGTARFRLPADQAGTYTLTVVDLAKGRKVYNPARNLETSESVASP